MGRTRASLWTVGMLALVTSVTVLTGCAPQTPGPAPSQAATPTAPQSASATPEPAPALVADGTALQNRAYFDSINRALIAANNSATGRQIIDSLVAAGFDKANMQLTADKTTINSDADSVLFSVRIGDSCLLGQRSGAEYVSSVQKALQSGACLVGQTRPIDW